MSLDTPGGTVYSDYASQRQSTQVISYYDGGGSASWVASTGRAVRFKPSSYPAYLDQALVLMYDEYQYLPDYVTINVYDDDGTSGQPGTVLYSAVHVPVRQYSWFWFNYDLSPDVTIASGSVYIEVYSDASGTYEAALYRLLHHRRAEPLLGPYGYDLGPENRPGIRHPRRDP